MDASDVLVLEQIKKLNKKIDKLQDSIDQLDAKLTKHIGFIDKTYEGPVSYTHLRAHET